MKKMLSLEVKLLIALIAVHVAINTIWIYINNQPPSWDAAAHTTIALDIADKLRTFQFLDVLRSSNYYPIFVHTTTALLILVAGPSFKVIQFTGTIFFVCALIFLYRYTLLLTSSRRVALFATILFSVCPIVFSESRRMMLDIPLTALVLLSLVLLQKSVHLTQKYWTFLFFASLGILILTKWTGIVFVAVPFVFALQQTIRRKKFVKALKPTVFGGIVGLLIAAPWYIVNFQSLRFLITVNSVGETGDPTNLFSVQNGIYYVQKIANYITTPLIALFILLAVVSLITVKSKPRLLLLTQVVVGVLAFSFIQNKDARYLIPLVPFMMIIVALFLERLVTTFKNVGVGITGVFVFLCMSYFLVLTIRPPILEGVRLSVDVPVIQAVNIIDIHDSVSKKANREVWPNSSIIAEVTRNPGNIVVAYETEAINPSTLSLYLKVFHYVNGPTKSTVVTPDPAFLVQEFHANAFPNREAIETYLRTASYVITSPDTTGVQDIKNVKALTQVRNYVEETHNCSNFVKEVALENTVCFVREGDSYKTGSDVLVDGKLLPVGEKTITGTATVRCPWGCSFGEVHVEKPKLHFFLKKEYSLSTGSLLNIYQVSSNSTQ